MISRIVLIEILVVGISGVFLTPIALVQALVGHWLGLSAYVRAAAWGGVFLFVVLFVVSAASR